MSQNHPKTTSLMTSLTKKPQPPIKKIFSSADCKTGWSVWALEQLSNAIGRGAMALVRQQTTAVFRPKSRYENIVRRPLVKYALSHLHATRKLWPVFEFEIHCFQLWCNTHRCTTLCYLTLWRPHGFGDIRKTTPKRTWLCARISLVWYALQTR